MADYVLSIGIDEYLHVNATIYAENDSRAFAEVMEDEFETIKPKLLLREFATKTNILSELRKICSKLDENDRFFFFYAGHGINYKGRPYLAVYDVTYDDPETLVSLDVIIETVNKTGCSRALYFIDACESTPAMGQRSIEYGLSLDELAENYEDSEYTWVFSSASHREAASINRETKHGIWTTFLLDGLQGHCKALTINRELTCESLQGFLKKSVKDHCKIVSEDSIQTSFSWGKKSAPILIKKFPEKNVVIRKINEIKDNLLVRTSFLFNYANEVSSLPGFNKSKGHKIPKDTGDYFDGLIADWADKEIREHVETVATKAREFLEISARNFTPPEYERGAGTFECPYFVYSFSVVHSKDDYSKCIFTGELEIEGMEKFNEIQDIIDECFDYTFDKVIYSFPKKKFDMKELIYTIDDNKKLISSVFDFSYENDLSAFRLTHKKDGRDIVINKDSIEIKFKASESIPEMVKALKDVNKNVFLVTSQKIYLLDSDKEK